MADTSVKMETFPQVKQTHQNDRSIRDQAFKGRGTQTSTCLRILITLHVTAIIVSSSMFFFFYNSILSEVGNLRSEVLGEPNRMPKSEANVDLRKNIKRSSENAHSLLEESLEGLEAVQLVGLTPLLHIKKNGIIGSWKMEGRRKWVSLSKDNAQLRIIQPGLYFVYAQIFYLTSEASNSFEIVRVSGNSTDSSRETLTVCANQAAQKQLKAGGSTEVSCYTGIVAVLHPPQRLFLNQIEQNRVVISSPGFSHWGLIKLQNGST